jgi:DNA-binding CsgD family transcriptional regulator
VEGQEIEAVEERLLVATRARLLSADQKGIFTFGHDKIREVLYAEVSTSRRQRLHEAIGRVLEARYDQENAKSSYRLTELAFHFARSRDRERGAAYSQRAAEQALQSYAIEEALAHYRAALDLLDPDDRRRGNLLLGLGQAALLAGTESQAASAYEEAFTRLSQDGERETAALAVHGLGLAQWRQEALQAAREALEQALVLLKDGISADVVRVLVDLSTLLTLYLGQQAEGAAYAQQALEMAHRLEDKSLEAAVSRAVSGQLYIPSRDIPLAVQSMEQALALSEASDDPSEAAECCLYLEGAYYWMAEIRGSYQISLRRIEFIERCRYPYQLRNIYSWPALLLCSQGKWLEARLAIERAQPIAASLSSPVPLAFLHQVRGFLAYQQEEYVFAEWEFQAAKEHPPRGPGGLLYTGLLGLAKVAVGKREEAYTYIAELEGRLAELPTGTLPTAPLLICLALMAIALEDQQQVADLYPRLLTFRGQHYWFLVDRVLGEMATFCRDWERAAIHLVAAKLTAEREGLRPELARIFYACASIELARNDQAGATGARNLLQQALAIFEELNMADSVNHVRRQLDALSRKPYRSTRPSLPASLTRSEARVLKCVAAGMRNRQIAQELRLSEKTIANHLTHIFEKTSSENRAAAAAFAIRHGLA